MKGIIIIYRNGRELRTQTSDFSKELNGWTLWNGLNGGVTFLSDTYIKDIRWEVA